MTPVALFPTREAALDDQESAAEYAQREAQVAAIKLEVAEKLGHQCGECLADALVIRLLKTLSSYDLTTQVEEHLRAAEQLEFNVDAIAGHQVVTTATAELLEQRELRNEAELLARALGWDRLVEKLVEIDQELPATAVGLASPVQEVGVPKSFDIEMQSAELSLEIAAALAKEAPTLRMRKVLEAGVEPQQFVSIEVQDEGVQIEFSKGISAVAVEELESRAVEMLSQGEITEDSFRRITEALPQIVERQEDFEDHIVVELDRTMEGPRFIAEADLPSPAPVFDTSALSTTELDTSKFDIPEAVEDLAVADLAVAGPEIDRDFEKWEAELAAPAEAYADERSVDFDDAIEIDLTAAAHEPVALEGLEIDPSDLDPASLTDSATPIVIQQDDSPVLESNFEPAVPGEVEIESAPAAVPVSFADIEPKKVAPEPPVELLREYADRLESYAVRSIPAVAVVVEQQTTTNNFKESKTEELRRAQLIFKHAQTDRLVPIDFADDRDRQELETSVPDLPSFDEDGVASSYRPLRGKTDKVVWHNPHSEGRRKRRLIAVTTIGGKEAPKATVERSAEPKQMGCAGCNGTAGCCPTDNSRQAAQEYVAAIQATPPTPADAFGDINF